jgi:GxxExxY protein
MRSVGLEVEQQSPVNVSYRGEIVGDHVADLVVNGVVIIEIKAVKALTKNHEAQLFNYLRATGLKVGLLLNFGSPRLEFRRLVL